MRLESLRGQLLLSYFDVASIDNRNLTEGPFASAGLPHTLGQVRCNDLYGIGVSVPLGRDSGFSGSGGLLHGLSRILQNDQGVLNRDSGQC